jgi:hypothetical protein
MDKENTKQQQPYRVPFVYTEPKNTPKPLQLSEVIGVLMGLVFIIAVIGTCIFGLNREGERNRAKYDQEKAAAIHRKQTCEDWHAIEQPTCEECLQIHADQPMCAKACKFYFGETK